jgi:DNA-binding transcriptional ArsR family regulator
LRAREKPLGVMKRDLDLVRRILLHLEEGEASPSGWGAFVDDGYDFGAIHFHVRLLNDAGLIEADEIVPGQWWPERMTWSGYEFLDAARNEELWQETKLKVEKSTGSAPFLVVHELLLRGLRARLVGASKRRSKSARTRTGPRHQ